MISTLLLKSGRSPGSPGSQIEATSVVVFVGPNNSGKSRILKEIERYCRAGVGDAQDLVIESVGFSGLESSAADEAISRIIQPPRQGESQRIGHVFVGSRFGRHHVQSDELKAVVCDPARSYHHFCHWYLSHSTLMLDGRSRIELVKEQAGGDLQSSPVSSFQVLFRDDAKRHEVRRVIFDAFGLHFVLDPTNLGKLRIRLSDRAPSTDIEERGVHSEAVNFHRNAQLIDAASDGVKAFTGIVTELLAGDPHVVLIDEPEAFLHPSLAAKLGQEVARLAHTTDKKVFVATHSPQFVMGCIQSGAPTTIVRLTYRSGEATSRILPRDEILELMRHPLLRSTGLLSGLFYEFVVVTESDTDRAFYQEINERLLRSESGWGIPNCLFINGQNKQTVQTLVRPLRKLGIPAVGVMDVDVVKDGGVVWTSLLSSAGMPELSHNSLAVLRSAVSEAMRNTGMDMKRDGGVEILEPSAKQAACDLFEQLRQYGIFIVYGGEIESWLKNLGATGHGSPWLINIFEKMGEDPDDCNYVLPGDDDVWTFMRDIKDWMINPLRKGIPS